MSSRRKVCNRVLALITVVLLCLTLVVVYENAVSTSQEPAEKLVRDTRPAVVTVTPAHPQSTHSEPDHTLDLLPNPPQRSRWAYTTLISGIDKSLRYKGFLLNALIMRAALRQLGSTADFVAMLGFREGEEDDPALFVDDVNLLIRHGVIVHVLPRLLPREVPLSFAEMALLKVTPYNFTEYDKVQFLDGDVMPTRNMDCYFSLDSNAFTVGAVSPLNSGWFLALPDHGTYEYFVRQALWRLGRDWDKQTGWGRPLPAGLQFRGMKKDHRLWDFNGADMDQGLFTDTFVLQRGGALLIDTDKGEAKVFRRGLLAEAPLISSSAEALRVCDGVVPTQAFVHYTGRSKPWMSDPQAKKRGRDWHEWMRRLDSLRLAINSSNVLDLKLGSPLGFFNANFPKGGYKTST